MDDRLIYIICIGTVLLIALIVVLIIVISSNKRNRELNDSMLKLRDSFNENLLKFSNNMNHDFNDLSDRVNSNLIQTHKVTNEVFNNINERMIRIDEAQKGINELSNEVVSLQKILTDKKSRGTFGEIELYSLLEAAYGTNYDRYQKQYHLPNGSIADAVIFGGDSLGILCIDSKFPLENYRRMYDESASAQEKEGAIKAFRNDVKKHIDDIRNKYIIPGVTADLAYMFIPAEAIFSEIYANFDELVDLSYQSKVYLVSPTTLMAYITAIKSIYLGQTKDQKAKEIQQLLSELSIEFDRFFDRTQALYNDYQKLNNDFDKVNVTANKIVKRFDRINAGEIEDEE